MKRHITLVLVSTLSMAAIAGTLMRSSRSDAQDPPAAKADSEVPAKRMLIGAASCAASVCHGGSDLGKPLSEATTWQALDPHGRAYDTLLSQQSRTIANHLWGGKKLAHDAPLCLKCHIHPDYDHARPNFRKADGVACESCHGAAQHWLTPHYRGDKRGMADTKSLYGRATICVKCHVGSADADVDHDLIAAGHPALRFEFATYFANLPPHWDVKKDKRANSKRPDIDLDYELRAWFIGQFVSAATALELRAHRADPANGKPWPELAEMDCFGCHHDLQGKSRPAMGRRPGRLEPNEWYFVMPSLISRSTQATPLPPVTRKDPRNRQEIARFAKDDAIQMRATANSGRDPLESWVLMRPMIARIYPDEKPTGRWDLDTQFYFALLAAQHPEAKRDLQALTKNLRDAVTFPPGFNSPRVLEPKN